MFWSGNYIAVRELNSLLKEENVTLTQVLEADDVLQECKADNKALIQFLTRPDILAELVTLITEEPPKNVELSLQYRHATIACEVLTSQLPTLSDRLSMDTAQMHRLCDFINREPPLNPLLASYFSKTIEMLLDRSPKQDWYLYHIVCLRVLDFLKARRDFLPNLLRHLHTSAVLDALKCFIRLNDLFNKLIMEWLEEHQFLEALISIICGTYEPPPLAPRPAETEKGLHEQSEKEEREGIEKGDLDAQGKETPEAASLETAQATGDASQAEADAETVADRLRAVASANAAALLTDIILNGCAPEYSQHPAGSARSCTAIALVSRATSAAGVHLLLTGMFTCGARARRYALVHGARALRAMRRADQDQADSCEQSGAASERSGVELAVAPHLPLLHTALLQAPEPYQHEPSASEAPADGGGGAGEAPPCDVTHCDVTHKHQPAVSTANRDNSSLNVASSKDDSASDVASNKDDPASNVASNKDNPTSDVASNKDDPTSDVASKADPLSTVNAGADTDPASNVDAEASQEPECASSKPENTEVPVKAAAPMPRQPCVWVGAARLELAALLAALCSSEVDEVASTMLTLGTPGVLIDMFFNHPDNNFLHAHVHTMVQNALSNRAYRTQYTRHILEECDLFNRLMDVYEENETKRGTAACPRAGYMGHVVLILRTLAPSVDGAALQRWGSVQPLIQRLDTPLGGYYPSENSYEVESADGMVEVETQLYNLNYSDYPTEEDLNEVASNANMNKFLELSNQRLCDNSDMWDEAAPGGPEQPSRQGGAERDDDDDDGGPRHTVHDVLAPVSPWETSYEHGDTAGEGWAQFSADAFNSSADPFSDDAFAAKDAFANDAFANDARNAYAEPDAFANPDAFVKSDAFAKDAFENDGFVNSDGFTKRERFEAFADKFGESAAAEEFTPFWGYQDKDGDTEDASGVEIGMRGLRLDKPMDELSSSLADNLRTAMSSMTPEVIANIVNANMTPALDVPLAEVPSVTDASNTNASVTVTDTSNITNVTEASNISVNAQSTSGTNDATKPSENSIEVCGTKCSDVTSEPTVSDPEPSVES